MSGLIVCWSTCWSCKFGCCYDPPQAHPWWDQDDVDYNAEAELEPPQGDCACSCSRSAVVEEIQ